MKTTLSTVILGLVLLFTGAAQAQLYDVYYIGTALSTSRLAATI